MREIKFRAWDRLRYKWVINGEMQGMFGFRSLRNPHYIWSQFTGLLDKNGKEIYEGDVLCIEDEIVADVVDGFERKEPHNKLAAVSFYAGCFGTTLGHFNQMEEEYGDPQKHWEVIGNIYENSDLLK